MVPWLVAKYKLLGRRVSPVESQAMSPGSPPATCATQAMGRGRFFGSASAVA